MLLVALGLVLVIESIGPFLNPRGMRKLYYIASQIPDRQLRMIGLAGMLLGVIIITWTGHG